MINNDVFQVLVVDNTVAALAAGNTVNDLAVGQIGVFDYNSGLSIDGTSPVKDFFVALGVDSTGNAAVNTIHMSSGQKIQRKNVRAYTYRPNTATQPMIVDYTGLEADCDETYGIKFELRNQEIYRRQGYNQFVRTFTYKTDCCDGCEGCPSGNCPELVLGLYNEILADETNIIIPDLLATVGELAISGVAASDGNVTVTIGSETFVVALLTGDIPTTSGSTSAGLKIINAINGTATSNYVAVGVSNVIIIFRKTSSNSDTSTIALVDTDSTGIFEFSTTPMANVVISKTAATGNIPSYDDVIATLGDDAPCVGLRLTTVPLAVQEFCGVNTNYFHPRQTIIIPSVIKGVDTAQSCPAPGSLDTFQEAVYEEGSGYDIQQKEYHAGAWNGRPGPYKVNVATGLAKKGITLFADVTTKYDQVALTYGQNSQAGWLDNTNDLATIFAFDVAAAQPNTGLEDFIDILDELLGPDGFDALADDLAASDSDPAVIETTESLDDVTLDGIA